MPVPDPEPEVDPLADFLRPETPAGPVPADELPEAFPPSEPVPLRSQRDEPPAPDPAPTGPVVDEAPAAAVTVEESGGGEAGDGEATRSSSG